MTDARDPSEIDVDDAVARFRATATAMVPSRDTATIRATAASRRRFRQVSASVAVALAVPALIFSVNFGRAGLEWIGWPMSQIIPGAEESPPTSAGLDGTFLYHDRERRSVVGYRDGVESSVVGQLPSSCANNTVTVSPDGAHIAWIQAESDSDGFGPIMVADAVGHGIRKLADHAACAGPVGLEWDGPNRLVFLSESHTFPSNSIGSGRTVDLATGVVQSLPVGDRGFWNSPDGRDWARFDPKTDFLQTGSVTGESLVDGVFGTKMCDSPEQMPVEADWMVYSVSAEARYVVLRESNDCDGQPLFAAPTRVVDTRTGADVTLPGAGRLASVIFFADGGMLLERDLDGARRLLLADANGQVSHEIAGRPGLGRLLGFTPSG